MLFGFATLGTVLLTIVLEDQPSQRRTAVRRDG
jgi:hypothetical protein